MQGQVTSSPMLQQDITEQSTVTSTGFEPAIHVCRRLKPSCVLNPISCKVDEVNVTYTDL